MMFGKLISHLNTWTAEVYHLLFLVLGFHIFCTYPYLAPIREYFPAVLNIYLLPALCRPLKTREKLGLSKYWKWRRNTRESERNRDIYAVYIRDMWKSKIQDNRPSARTIGSNLTSRFFIPGVFGLLKNGIPSSSRFLVLAYNSQTFVIHLNLLHLNFTLHDCNHSRRKLKSSCTI